MLRHLTSQSRHSEGSDDLPVGPGARTWGSHIPPIHSPHRGLAKKTQLKLEVINQTQEEEAHARDGSPWHGDAVGPIRDQERKTPASLRSQACPGGCLSIESSLKGNYQDSDQSLGFHQRSLEYTGSCQGSLKYRARTVSQPGAAPSQAGFPVVPKARPAFLQLVPVWPKQTCIVCSI